MIYELRSLIMVLTTMMMNNNLGIDPPLSVKRVVQVPKTKSLMDTYRRKIITGSNLVFYSGNLPDDRR